MNKHQKAVIVSTFNNEFEEVPLGIELSLEEFEAFEEGIFAKHRDQKWNAFVYSDTLWLSRSWSGYAIYKVIYVKRHDGVILDNVKVNRNPRRYKGTDLGFDVKVFKNLLEGYIGRGGLLIDERLKLGLIKKTLQEFDANKSHKIALGSQSVGLNLALYDSLVFRKPNSNTVDGLEEFKSKVSHLNPATKLLSLNLSKDSVPDESVTFFYDQEATQLLGKVSVLKK